MRNALNETLRPRAASVSGEMPERAASSGEERGRRREDHDLEGGRTNRRGSEGEDTEREREREKRKGDGEGKRKE